MKFLTRICPICAVVSSTWAVLLVLKYFNVYTNEYLLGLLMGGSAVGVSYVLANSLALGGKLSGQTAKLWKFVSIPVAFSAMYVLSRFNFALFIALAVTYVIIYYFFRPAVVEGAIKKELESCC